MKRRTIGAVGWVAVGAVAAALGVRALLAHSPSHNLPSAAAAALAADGMTPLGGRPAPDFHLVDQNGKPVSLSQFRGKTVILTFLDPVCWWDCPLQAAEMAGVDQLLGPYAKSVELVAVAGNPTVHSVSALSAFDRARGLNHIPNWVFATGSTATLEQIWQAWGYQVTPATDGMDPHSDLFYLIDPQGRLQYLSNPEANLKVAGGTSALLAAYAARLSHLPVTIADGPALPLGKAAPVAPLGPGGPVAVASGSGQPSWAVANVQNASYQVVEHSNDDGQHWTDVGPPGLSKRGGTVLAAVDQSTAWAAVRPYGFQTEPAVFSTSDGGKDWRGPGLLPGPLSPGQSLAAENLDTAWVATADHLYQTQDGGTVWKAVAELPVSPSASLSLSWTEGRLWLASGNRLWQLAGTIWQPVSLPTGLKVSQVGTPLALGAKLAVPALAGGPTPQLLVAVGLPGAFKALPTLELAAPNLSLVASNGGVLYALARTDAGATVMQSGGDGTWTRSGIHWQGEGIPSALAAFSDGLWVTSAGDKSRYAYRSRPGGEFSTVNLP